MKKLLFVVNVDWFFISHRLPIALSAMNQGYDIHLACGITNQYHYLIGLGINVHPLPLSRSGTSWFNELKTFKTIFQVIKNIKPDIIHMVTSKPVIYAGIASLVLGINKRVASISGLGYIFIDNTIKSKIIRFLVIKFYKLSLHNNKTNVIFQNKNDRDLFCSLNILKKDNSLIIRGSGVKVDNYHVIPEPNDIPVVMLVARLLYDKGVMEFVNAAKILKSEGIQIRMVLVGNTDENPKSVKKEEIDHWVKQEIVEYWGYRHDIDNIMSKANIIVLPSYREGLPKSLIEAAACGRAVITTDVPGCRDAIINNVTGLLVPVKDSFALSEAIQDLISNSEKRNNMANEGRKLAERVFDISLVISKHLEIYNGKGSL
ncbi:N,N'-diacetylbacillosaminyl-diphospho-undecaprenol alpha-1,3-N-acetylgalactosaminyltransferase [Photorhabdus australis subsp. thailandensis]|uniref:N, N'-diacetylbacillosaminyl-diphospho-undecaprenol alpha-1,3-N-acetylgalactosaminyltransferase n=1 Tax=Photorhabdus australis subsp. thailandensis TaxID=2805096 RepID=A0A1C0U8Z3_9GAMM|nr:glycosyltransferase family 4 protein [Photorhabdus australis]OCQ54410.1 N,N'-diacetylbacillosaminyl-diphospho-undecaprenol alpha-1,3-N-acetylgalactosaminyltransferase [Photorhabdus australis subsp. thailandensis]